MPISMQTRTLQADELIATQAGIWFAEQVSPTQNEFNVAHYVEIPLALDITHFSQAIDEILAQVDTLNSLYQETEQGVEQVFLPEPRLFGVLETLDFTDQQTPMAAALDWMQQDLNQSIPLTQNQARFRHCLIKVIKGDQPHWLWYQRYHHIDLDGYSFNRISEHIVRRYNALIQVDDDLLSSEFEVTPFTLVMAEYQAYGSSESYQQDKAFWSEYVSDLPPAISLTTGAGEHDLSASEPAYLKAVLREERCISEGFFHALSFASTTKPFAKLMDAEIAMAAIFVYLYLHSREASLCIGFPFMRRLGSCALNAMGPVVNVLPLKLSLSDDMSLAQVTKTMNRAIRQIRPHQAYEAQQIQRDTGHVGDALFGPILNYKPFMAPLEIGGKRLESHLLSAGPIDGIEFSPSVRKGALYLEISANAKRYSQQALALHFDRFQHVLLQIQQNPELTLAEISLVSEAEMTRVSAWGQGDVFKANEPDTCVLHKLIRVTDSTPDKVALVYKDQQWRFSQLLEAVDARAAKLVSLGINKGDVVAIALARSPQVIISMLACFRAGATYLPIDLAYPAPRIRSIVEQARPELILVDDKEALIHVFDNQDAYQPLPLAQLDEVQNKVVAPEWPNIHAADLAYILFTSGSTGQPKGVMNTQGGLLNLLHSHQRSIFAKTLNKLAKAQNTEPDRVMLNAAHVTSFAFDASFEQVLWMLSGQTLFLYDEEERRDAQALVERVQDDKIHALDLPPSLLNQMLDSGLMSGDHQPSLIMIGSEAVPSKLWSRLAAYPNVLVQNFYGPTEFTVDAVSASITDDLVPVIGRPLLNTQAYVLQQDLTPCPVGVIGELYLAGEGMAKGYLNQAGMSAERFVANPFASGQLMYRTGDLVRWRDSGQLDFIGRSDNQVKVRGFRIELGEVEAAISQIEGIDSTLVIAKPQEDSHRLLAYCTLDTQQQTALDEGQIMALISQSLPDYMQPAGLAVLTAWPLNINGKIDKHALPDIQQNRPNTSRDAKSPQEKILCHAVATQLGLAQVGIEDDFFNLGGDSISAMGLGTLLRKQGYQLRPREVFSGRSLERIACLMTPLQTKESLPQEGVIPALPMWQWFQQHFDEQTRYVQGVMVSIEAELDIDQIKQGLAALLAHNAVLRLAYQNGEYRILEQVQVRAKLSSYFAMAKVDDLSHSSLDELFYQHSQSLSLQQESLFKMLFLEDKKGNKGLMLLAHHLVIDGVSWRLLLPQLKALVWQQKTDLVLEETGINTWSHTLQQQVPARRQEAAYWREILAQPSLPLGHAELVDEPVVVGHARHLLSAPISQALLQDFSTHTDIKLEEALLAALTLSLAKAHNLSHLKVNLESHGREEIADDIDVSQTLGWFTSEFPIVIEAVDDLSAQLRKVKQASRSVPDKGLGFMSLRYLDDVYQHEFASLEKANPSQILFNYLGRFDSESGHWQAQQREGVFADNFAVFLDAKTALMHDFEINVFVDESGESPQLAMHWNWNKAHFSDQVIRDLTDQIQAQLEAILVWSEQPNVLEQTRVAADLTYQGLTNAQWDNLVQGYGAVADVLPALPLQQGLFYQAQLGGEGSHYNSTTRLTLEGQVRPEAIQAGLNAVIARHPQLLAKFDSHLLGEVIQIMPSQLSPWPLALQDWRQLNASDQQGALLAFEKQELAYEFDLSDGQIPLLKATLIQLSDSQFSLFISAHHLVVDGWSTPILLKDFLLTYAQLSHKLTPITQDYPSVVAKLSQRDKDQARALWQAVLADCQPSIAFEEIETQAQVNEISLTLDKAKTQRINQLLRQQGLTLNTLMQGIWASILGTMTGREDVVFGTPISGRFGAIEGIDEHIGLFSNTVPVRVQLNPETSLLSQLSLLQEQQIQLLEHDVLGLADIQRLAASDTLFDTLLVVENYPDNQDWFAKDYQGAKLSDIHNRGYTHYPLTLLVLPSDELHILIEYRDTQGVAQQVADRLLQILEDIAQTPEKPLAQWDLRLPKEVALNQRVNCTQQGIDATDLRTLMSMQAIKTPDALALQDETSRYSYQAMRAQVLGIAALLEKQGVGAGDIVAVALPRSVKLSLALNSILELGAAYLPLDVAYPDDRLAYMIEDAKPKLVITLAAFETRFAPLAELVYLDSLPAPVSNPLAKAKAPLDPESGAYIIYTSGSTGKPKGVLVSHKAIVNRLLWMQSEYPLNGDDVVLQKTPCSFDVSVWEFFWPLIEGACLMMAAPETHKDPDALLQIMEDYQVSTLHFVPSMLAAFMTSLTARFKPDEVIAPALKRVFCSGEALSKELSLLYGQYLNAPLHNLYGPTEAAVDVSYCPAFGDELNESLGNSVPIGLPVWNTQLYVLDSFLRQVPVGVPGELYLAGDQLAIGYLNRSGLTADRFMANPFSEGDRMYRTGDVVRWLASGKVEYLGRSDDQLKIRGQRIELGEIETALAALDGIKQALVCAKTLNANDSSLAGADSRQLVAYVIEKESVTLDMSQLRIDLTESLPAHMVPVVIMALDAFPLSANGKLDRKALPLPSDLQCNKGCAPKEGLETELANIFCQVLGCEEVSADDDFFALGGHSLLAMQLTAKIRQSLSIPVSIGQIMVSPSVEKLAVLLSDDTAMNDASQAGLGQILPIRSGAGPALFCINSASGYAWQYMALLKHLGGQYPVQGLQSPRADGAMADALDMDDAVSIYLDLVKEIQPHGPYHLLGYSFGGNIAQGLAVRLQTAGEEVAFLGLLDTYPPEGQDWDGPINEQEKEEIEREKALFLNANNIDDDELNQQRLTMFNDIEANYVDSVRLLSSAQTGKFNGEASLFVARRTVPEGYDIDKHWSPFLDELQQHSLDCSHEDVIAPDNVAEVGAALKVKLDKLASLKG